MPCRIVVPHQPQTTLKRKGYEVGLSFILPKHLTRAVLIPCYTKDNSSLNVLVGSSGRNVEPGQALGINPELHDNAAFITTVLPCPLNVAIKKSRARLISK